MNYKPKQQDIIWINFQPSKGHEMYGRHPAVVISISGYTEVTNLVTVCPITHARHNELKSFFLPLTSPISVTKNYDHIDGYINPLQFYTFDVNYRYAEFSGLLLPDSEFLDVLRVHKRILNI